MKKIIVACFCLGLFFFMSPQFSASQDAKSATDVIKLPPPQTDGGKPLMQALKARQSTRGNFGPAEKLSMQTLSNLLWAADGVNRPPNHRTAPSAVDWQNIDIYVATADGLFVYDAPQHALKVITKEDVRAIAGLEGMAGSKMMQDFAKTAPVSLVYVANLAKAKMGGQPMQWGGIDVTLPWTYTGAGAIAQNVYLFCSSEGLACILRAMIDPDRIAKTFKLGPDQKAILTSTIAQFKK
jgi:hypothetical protein